MVGIVLSLAEEEMSCSSDTLCPAQSPPLPRSTLACAGQREQQRRVHGRVAGNANRMVELLLNATRLCVARSLTRKSRQASTRSPNSGDRCA